MPHTPSSDPAQALRQPWERTMTATPLLSILPSSAPPELIDVIEDAALRKFHQHGADAFAAPREAAIAHEVGHAVVATHEGMTIESVRIFARSATAWSGWCAEKDSKQWTTGPNSRAENDLSRARIIIAGLAGEVMAGLDKPGSSLDELAFSQLIGINAGLKLGDPTLSDEAHSAYVQQLWHEQVWDVALAILHVNHEPFRQLAECLSRRQHIKGGKLRTMLAKVRRIP
jgi:hypothetical protein